MIAHQVKGYGLVIMTNSDSGGALIQDLQKRIEQNEHWDMFDKPIPRIYGPPGD